MAHSIRNHITKLEKLSLVTCTNEVQLLLERALKNVEPILSVDTKGVEPLLWQDELSPDRLTDDKPNARMTNKDLKTNASEFYEGYVAIGRIPKSGTNPKG